MLKIIYDVKGKHPASHSMTGYLSKYHLEDFKENNIVCISIKNFGKQLSNDAMTAAFIEDLCSLANKGIKILVS